MLLLLLLSLDSSSFVSLRSRQHLTALDFVSLSRFVLQGQDEDVWIVLRPFHSSTDPRERGRGFLQLCSGFRDHIVGSQTSEIHLLPSTTAFLLLLLLLFSFRWFVCFQEHETAIEFSRHPFIRAHHTTIPRSSRHDLQDPEEILIVVAVLPLTGVPAISSVHRMEILDHLEFESVFLRQSCDWKGEVQGGAAESSSWNE